jgi:PPOX class probable F420-dependent enzyme
MTFDDLRDQEFIVLTTYRRDGTAVPTTVWFAHHGDAIVVATGASTGKVMRIRNDTTVTMAASNFRGKLKGGGTVDGDARLLSGAEADRAHSTLASKYGWQWRLFARHIDTIIEITPPHG